MNDHEPSIAELFYRDVRERLNRGEPVQLEPIFEGIDTITIWPEAEAHRLN